MTDSAAEVYLGWLGQRITSAGHKSYTDLYAILLQKEFIWIPNVGNDDNRIADGFEIRQEFTDETGVIFEEPCSVLEVIIGLARRLEFMAGGEAAGWAWQLICNLGLHKFADPVGPRKAIRIEEILERFIWRNYEPDGTGGLFPLAWPDDDQRKVEIWYQMAYYVEEIHPEY